MKVKEKTGRSGALPRGPEAPPHKHSPSAVHPPAVHPFDKQYGVDTSGLIWGEHLATGSPDEYWVTGYYGVSPSVFSQVLERLGLDWSKYTFVDIGCGKGRALMLALRYPFRRALGVEIAPQLVEIAKSNLAHFSPEWRQCFSVDVIQGDATKMQLPPEPLVLYLYHPFARPLMTQFLGQLQRSLRDHPRSIYLLYTNPELDQLISEGGFLQKIWDESFFMDDQDAGADHFNSVSERTVAYKST